MSGGHVTWQLLIWMFEGHTQWGFSVRITWHGNSKAMTLLETRTPDGRPEGDLICQSIRNTLSQTYDNHVGLMWADNLTLFVCPLPQPEWKLWASEFDLVRCPEYPGPASWWKTRSWPSHHRMIRLLLHGMVKLISDCKGCLRNVIQCLIHPCN